VADHESPFAAKGYAADNPAHRPKSYKPIRTPETDVIGIQRNLCNKEYTENLTEGINRFIATVLRIENKNTSKQDDSFFPGWFTSIFAEEEVESPVVITAIIDCDLHAIAWGKTGVGHPNFRMPLESGQGGSNRIIDKIRDAYGGMFRAQDTSINSPAPGEKVWVTFGDLANRRDGIFLGPLIKRENGAPPRNSGTVTNRCNQLTSTSPDGRSVNSSNARTRSILSPAQLKAIINAKIERGQFPIGKGVFTGIPDLSTHKVELAEQATLNWVCYTGLRQEADGTFSESLDATKTKEFANKYHEKGIRTYIMGYPAYGQEEKFISEIVSMAAAASAIGIIINLDNYQADSAGTTPHEREKYLMTSLRENAKKQGFCVGLSATNIMSKKDTPWKIFSDKKTGVDFAIPQVLNQTYKKDRDAELGVGNTFEQAGPTKGRSTSFNDITTKNYVSLIQDFNFQEGFLKMSEDVFIKKWHDRREDNRGFKPINTDVNRRAIFMMAACEVIEIYWQQVYSDSRVFITSHYRGNSPNHKSGAAVDIRIEYGQGFKERVPALQIWAGLKKLQAAGRLPKGGTGLYLNVSSGGITGTEIAQAGKKSVSYAPPGASATPHYDLRGFTYGKGSKKKNTIWVDLDTTGDGKDDIKGHNTVHTWLRSHGLTSVSNFVKKDNGTWQNDPSSPDVGGAVPNMKQVLGLSSVEPFLPQSLGELAFVKQLKAWKNIGFKHIIPALGMIGRTPNPDGWTPDGYNTKEKSPYRMREEATWTFTSTRDALADKMANAVIWWNWEGANKTEDDWPEKRWDIIKELGNTTETAQKLNSLNGSDMDEVEKGKIKMFNLSEFLKTSPSPGETLKDKREREETPPQPPAGSVPTLTQNPPPPDPTGLTEKQKKEIQEEIDTKTKDIKEEEIQLQELKSKLENIGTSGTGDQKEKAIADIKSKQEAIKEQMAEINILLAKLQQEKMTGEDSPPADAAEEEAPPPADKCKAAGSSGDTTPQPPLTKGEVKTPVLDGVEFVDFEFKKSKRKTTNYLIIHTPAGAGDYIKLANTLKSKGFGVHFTVARDGTARQHASMEDVVSHAPPLNGDAIGIEFLNSSSKGSPTKKYKPGTMKQYEGLYKLVKKIVKATSIPLEINGANHETGEFYFGWKQEKYNGLKPGIVAHGSFLSSGRQHGDGRFSALYIALRKNGNSPGSAYKMTLDAHTKQSNKNGGSRFYKEVVFGLKKGEANTSPPTEVT